MQIGQNVQFKLAIASASSLFTFLAAILIPCVIT